MEPISNLQHYNKEIDEILAHHDSFTQNRLFNLYTSIPFEKQKEAFVLALIGRTMMLEARLKYQKNKS